VKRALALAALLTALPLVGLASRVEATTFYACAGAPADFVAAFDATDGAVDGKVSYAEPRLWLENQAWWEPQPADAGSPGHPSVGKQGHVHLGTCFPHYQTLNGPSLHLDVNAKFHNITGQSNGDSVHAFPYGDFGWGSRTTAGVRCAAADCEWNVSFDLPFSPMRFNGWHEFHLYQYAVNSTSARAYTVTRWYANVDRPDLPEPTTSNGGTTVLNTTNALRGLPGTGGLYVGGDTWHNNTNDSYARATIKREDVPWDETTGQLRPVSGVWRPTVNFERTKVFAFVDPALHADPPSFGTVVLDEYPASVGGPRQLAIDTTQLSDGVHRLLIGTSNVGTDGSGYGAPGNPFSWTVKGKNSGVLVIPFLVDNDPCS
jgi:hypothetical protein